MSSHSRSLTNPSPPSTGLIAAQVVATFFYCIGFPIALWLLGGSSNLVFIVIFCAVALITGLGDALLASRTFHELVVNEDLVSVRVGLSTLQVPRESVSVARRSWLLRLLWKRGSILRSKEGGLWVFVPASVASGDELAAFLSQR